MHQRVKEALYNIDKMEVTDPKHNELLNSCFAVLRRHADEEENEQLPFLRKTLGHEGNSSLFISLSLL